MLNVFVSMGKQMPKDKGIVEDAENVAKILAKYGCTMVQTGAKLGLMGVAVQEFEKYSNEMVMITPEQFKTDLDKHVCKQNFVVELECDRMKTAINNFDLAVILPGGMGTFAELAYFNEVCKSGESNAKLVVLNSKGYYNSLMKFFKHQMKLGFINEDSIKFQVVKNANAFEHILQNLIAEKHAQIYQEELQNARNAKKVEEQVVEKEDEVSPALDKKLSKKSSKKTAKSTNASSKVKSEKVSNAGRPKKVKEELSAKPVEEIKAKVEEIKENVEKVVKGVNKPASTKKSTKTSKTAKTTKTTKTTSKAKATTGVKKVEKPKSTKSTKTADKSTSKAGAKKTTKTAKKAKSAK